MTKLKKGDHIIYKRIECVVVGFKQWDWDIHHDDLKEDDKYIIVDICEQDRSNVFDWHNQSIYLYDEEWRLK